MRRVICYGPLGETTIYNSIAEAARKLNASASSIEESCRRPKYSYNVYGDSWSDTLNEMSRYAYNFQYYDGKGE